MPQKIKPTPIKHCATCNLKMERQRYAGVLESMNNFLRRKYCNRSCMAKGMEREICSSLSHSRIKAHRSVKGHCQMCAATRRLHVHHKDGNPRNNTAENLMTLCPSCHRQIHSKYFDLKTMQRVPCLHCDKPAVRAWLCHSHLTRRAKYGDPTLTKVRMSGGVNVLIRSASIRTQLRKRA